MPLFVGRALRTAAAALSVTVVASMTVIASAGAAEASATGCSPPSSTQITHYQACISTSSDSTGLFVDEMDSWGETKNKACLHLEIQGPDGKARATGSIVCYDPGSSILFVQGVAWTPDRNVESGSFCAILWKGQSSPFTNVAEACIGVSS